jgi:hypothetical protein
MGIVTADVTSSGTRKDFSAIGGAYSNLLGSLSAGVILAVWNTTNEDMYLSLNNGVTDSVIVPSGGALELNFGANGLNPGPELLIRTAGGIPVSGGVYASLIRRM